MSFLASLTELINKYGIQVALFLVRYLIPPFILVILWISVRDASAVAFG